MLLVVLWRLRYKLRLRDLAELFLPRGVGCTHEAVRDWEARVAPLLTARRRAQRRGRAGRSWYVDETSIKVNGTWCYLYRAIDRDGHLVDARLSETRDMDAAQRFLRQAVATVGHLPERVTTDGHDAYRKCQNSVHAGVTDLILPTFAVIRGILRAVAPAQRRDLQCRPPLSPRFAASWAVEH